MRPGLIQSWLFSLLLCSGLSYCCAAGAVEAAPAQLAGVTTVRQQDGRLGLVVPLSVRNGALRRQRRRLHNHGSIAPVLGAVREGYFYAQLPLGTPPKIYSTIIDTGSSITYIPCSRCKMCGTHMASPFDPTKSSTAHWVGCSDKQCQCGMPACTCREQTCYYTRHYAEESSSEGWMVADKLHLPAAGADGSNATTTRAVDVVFGCENVETGEIFRQRVDGVLGMGNNVNSLPRQLARAGVIENVFALCYGFPQGGSMLLGDLALDQEAKLTYTPFLQTAHSYYTIATTGLSVSGKALPVNPADFSRGYGTVLDSGTTFIYLPTAAYKAFFAAVKAAVEPAKLRTVSGSDPSYNDMCWEGAPDDWQDLNKVFPTGNMTFAGGAFIELVPYRYLFKSAAGQYCLGVFDNGAQGTLLGGIVTRNVLVKYDKEKNRAGFGHVDCNTIKPAAQAQHGKAAGSAHSQPQHQQQPEPPDGQQGHTTSQHAGTDSSTTGAGTDQQRQHAAAAPAAELGGDMLSGSSSSNQHDTALSRKLLWLGVAVGALLLVAIVQLAHATLWKPPPGSSKGSSSDSGLLPRAFGREHSRYQQVGTTDDQELVELPERGPLVQNAPQNSQQTGTAL